MQNWADQLGNVGDFSKTFGDKIGLGEEHQDSLNQLTGKISNQFGDGPKRPEKTGNEAVDTFNDYNQQASTYLKTAKLANESGAGNTWTQLAEKASPYQEQAQEYGYKASQSFKDGSFDFASAGSMFGFGRNLARVPQKPSYHLQKFGHNHF